MRKTLFAVFCSLLVLSVFAAMYHSDPDEPGIYNVRHFGAVGDGLTDDTIAIQNAVDAAYQDAVNAPSYAAGGVVYFPSGYYKVTTIAKTWTAGVPITFRGDGIVNTNISNISPNTEPIFNFNCETDPTITYLRIEHMTLASNEADCNCLVIEGHALFTVDSVRCIGGPVGIDLDGAIIGTIQNSELYVPKIGIQARKSTIGTNHVSIRDCVIRGCLTYGIYLEGGGGFLIDHCDIESNGTSGDKSTGAIRIGSNIGHDSGYGIITIRDCWFESNKGYDVYNAGVSAKAVVTIENCLSVAGEKGIYFDGGVTAPKLALRNCVWPNTHLEFEEKQNIVAFIEGCTFVSITGLVGNYIHILGTDYDRNFYPQWRSDLNTSGNVSGSTYSTDGSISDAELQTIDDWSEQR